MEVRRNDKQATNAMCLQLPRKIRPIHLLYHVCHTGCSRHCTWTSRFTYICPLLLSAGLTFLIAVPRMLSHAKPCLNQNPTGYNVMAKNPTRTIRRIPGHITSTCLTIYKNLQEYTCPIQRRGRLCFINDAGRRLSDVNVRPPFVG